MIDITNYLQNQLPTKDIANRELIILKEAWMKIKQNFECIEIFGSKVSIYIFFKKRIQLNVHKCNDLVT